MNQETIIKVRWNTNKNQKWFAELKTVEERQFKTKKLYVGQELNIEVLNKRKCVGFFSEKGKRQLCPNDKMIKRGNQCKECRNSDIYTDYIRGDENTTIAGNFSVYLAQIGSEAKVGVTKTGRIMERWIEQGADYATQLETGIEAKEALKMEKNISKNYKINQRISKNDKINAPKNSKILQRTLKKIDMPNQDIENIQAKTVYNQKLSNNLNRSGLFKGEIAAVKGKIISNGRLNMVLSSGKVIGSPTQNSLNNF